MIENHPQWGPERSGPEAVERDAGAITAAYLKRRRGKWMLLAGLCGLVIMVAAFAVTRGAYEIALKEVVRALAGQSEGTPAVVIANIRLPRVAAAVCCGWGLALAGLSLQTLLNNPLAAPSTLGISQGAAFGASLAIVIFKAADQTVTAFAFGGAMGTVTIILLLGRLKKLSPAAILLAGVALSALFHSAMILVQYLATETELATAVFWTFGDVARSGWRPIGLAGAVIVPVTALLTVIRWDLNALTAGGEAARGLGVRVDAVRVAGLLCAALVVAVVTAFHGVIAFVGLIAPHSARLLVGDDHRLLIPFAAVLGALLLLAADTFGRLYIGAGALPVGVVTSFLGAPAFLYLIMRGYR